MKHKIRKFTSVLLAIMMLFGTVSVSSASLDLTPLGTEKATVNGQEVNVGEKVKLTYYVSSDLKWQDFQGYVTYDSTGLRLENFALPNTTTNVMTNTSKEGYLYYLGTSYSDFFDFTSEKVFLTADFTVLSAGNYTVENIWEVIDDENYDSIVDYDFYDDSRLSCRFETSVISEETETTTTSVIVTDQYTVTFKNYDGTVISTQQYDAGEAVVRPTETPVKPADKQYTYTFSGWDKEVAQTVNADATYTAVFTRTLNKYSVSVSTVNGTVTGCPTEDVDYSTSVTLNAKANEGYTFAGYYVGNTRVSISSTYTFTVTDNTEVVAKFNQMPGSELKVQVVGGTGLKVKIGANGVETTQSIFYDNKDVKTGQYVTLTPTGISGYDFLYWISDNGKIVSYSQVYTFMFTGQTSLTAVYSQVSAGAVTFMSGYNQINSSMCYGSADEITLPTPYAKSGYTFKFWSINGTTECTASDIYTASQSGNVTVKAVYEADEVYYNLTINGGAIVSVDDSTADAGKTTGSYKRINAVKVKANVAEAGKKFAYWTDQDGNILTYSRSHILYLDSNTTITAVYVDENEVVDAKAIARISSISLDETTNKMKVVAVLTVPSDCTIVSAGVLLTNNSAIGTSDESFICDNIQTKIVENVEDGNYQIYQSAVSKKDVFYGDVWFIRAYVSYKDSNGNVSEVYGDVVTNESLFSSVA